MSLKTKCYSSKNPSGKDRPPHKKFASSNLCITLSWWTFSNAVGIKQIKHRYSEPDCFRRSEVQGISRIQSHNSIPVELSGVWRISKLSTYKVIWNVYLILFSTITTNKIVSRNDKVEILALLFIFEFCLQQGNDHLHVMKMFFSTTNAYLAISV